MLNTSYNQIVNTAMIGTYEKINVNDVVSLALDEQLKPSNEDGERVLFLGIDLQNDFMEEGAIGVPGAHQDVERITRFLYNNMERITNIAVSLDTHGLHQIFHPTWWVDPEGKHPEPLTIITTNDLKEDKWKPVIKQEASIEYVKNLEEKGQKICAFGLIIVSREHLVLL
ncbi:hypothetical protein [Piscibacillus salipiscarius]|uniref:hypothetical protein n=1 Tax=Piscibacillus salipiscarius TaxID=299480 RepID=UPI002437342A|nr:hypothetical protein [Piscibacillus salipiscarius]